jgi:hypothetical protein
MCECVSEGRISLVRACVRACVRASERASVRMCACVHSYVCGWVGRGGGGWMDGSARACGTDY